MGFVLWRYSLARPGFLIFGVFLAGRIRRFVWGTGRKAVVVAQCLTSRVQFVNRMPFDPSSIQCDIKGKDRLLSGWELLACGRAELNVGHRYSSLVPSALPCCSSGTCPCRGAMSFHRVILSINRRRRSRLCSSVSLTGNQFRNLVTGRNGSLASRKSGCSSRPLLAFAIVSCAVGDPSSSAATVPNFYSMGWLAGWLGWQGRLTSTRKAATVVLATT